MFNRQVNFLSFIFFLVTLLSSCAKEEFAANKNETNENAPLTFSSTDSICSNYSHIKPNVDLLFLWDNTSSQVFVNDSTKQALNNTINLLSSTFDYHILLAPLVIGENDDVNTDTYFISYSTVDLTSDALSRRINIDDATTVLQNFETSQSADEKGLKRTADLIEANVENGIFRKNSYVVIVIMSNGDDRINNENGVYDPIQTSNYVHQQKNRLIELRDEDLKSLQLRFLSMVPQTDKCQDEWKLGASYIEMSSLIYNSSYPDIDINEDGEIDTRTQPSDQIGRIYPDSYNICDMDFLHIFDGINNTITDVTIPHRYDHWPISEVEFPLTFDPSTLRVQKNTGDEFFEVPGSGNGDGWTYLGYKTNQVLNYEPLDLAVETYTGHVIELHGNARVSHPECLLISFESPTYYYGYVALKGKPLENSIVVKKNGVELPQSSIDGWEFIGFKDSINIKIQGPNNSSDPHLEALPSEIKTNDYFIKMNGNAIYKSGDNINVIYDPAGT